MYMGDGDNLHNPFLTSTVFDWSTYAYVTSLIALYLGDDARYGIQLLFNAWLLENRMCAHERVHVIFNSNRRCRITSGLLAYRSIKTFPNQNVSPKTMVVNTNTYRKFQFFGICVYGWNEIICWKSDMLIEFIFTLQRLPYTNLPPHRPHPRARHLYLLFVVNIELDWRRHTRVVKICGRLLALLTNTFLRVWKLP